jgi:hypothetical protein
MVQLEAENRQNARFGGVTPVPVSFDALRKQVNKLIPDEAVKALAAEKPDGAKIARVNAAAAGINKAAGEIVFDAFKNEAVARLFAGNPDNFRAIADAAKYSSKQAFDALANPAIRSAYEKDPKKVIGSFGAIAKNFGEFGGQSAFGALSSNAIADMFVHEPERLAGLFGDMEKRLGESSSGYAFGYLKNDAVARSFAREPEKIVGALEKISGAVGNGSEGMFVFDALENGIIAKKFAEKPDEVAEHIAKTIKVVGRDNVFPAFTALKNDENAGLFAHEPERMMEAFKKIAAIHGQGSFFAFKSLGNKTLSKLFSAEPEKMADAFNEFANAGEWAAGAFPSFEKPRVAEFFLKNPKGIIELTRETGKEAEHALGALENGEIADMFEKNPGKIIDAFAKIAKLPEQTLFYAYRMLEVETVAGFFVSDPDKAVAAFGQIAEIAGNGYPEAFNALRIKSVSKMLAENTEGFIAALRGLAEATGENRRHAFELLHNEKIGGLFAENPEKLAGALGSIAKDAGSGAENALISMEHEKIGGMFASDPDRVVNAFREISQAAGKGAEGAFYALHKKNDVIIINSENGPKEPIAELFVSDTDKAVGAFRDLAKATGENSAHAMGTLSNGRIADKFVRFANDRNYQERLLAAIFSDGNAAIESGRPIDDLHESAAARAAYIKSLSPAQVIGLLCSDPGYFFTSSNHLLFDRLKKDIGGSAGPAGTLAYLKNRYDLDDGQLTNMVFRAANYGRLLGAPNAVFGPSDTKSLGDILLGGIRKEGYDSGYYYLLANAVRNVSTYFPEMIRTVNSALEKEKQVSDRFNALTAIKYLIRPESVDAKTRSELQKLNEKSIYKRSDYAVDGKVQVLQVFCRKDTEKDHWPLTQKWFRSRYGAPVSDDGKEVVYEGKGARVVLYMGDDEKENVEYAKNWIGANSSGIITFRGHSFSLYRNMPYDVFGNRKGKFIFIPGSCGSSGSVPLYMIKNPETDLRHFSNTSTGRGQVTNAIVDLLLDTSVATRFPELLRANERKIRANGGDLESINSIRVWCEGELLTNFVISRQEKKDEGRQN